VNTGRVKTIDVRLPAYLRVSNLFQETTHRMSKEVLEKMVADYLSRQFPVSVFSWQGGEPTLCGLDFFREAVYNSR